MQPRHNFAGLGWGGVGWGGGRTQGRLAYFRPPAACDTCALRLLPQCALCAVPPEEWDEQPAGERR